MKKKLIYISLICAICAVIFLIVYNGITGSSASSGPDEKKSRFNKENDFSIISLAQYSQSDYVAALDSFDNISYKKFIEELETGKRNFIWEVWALRDGCPETNSLDQCNFRILDMIDSNKKYSDAEKEKLKGIFTSYFNYENSIREIGFDNIRDKFTEKYTEIKKKRREFFTDDDVKLVFGMEESQVAFMDASADFANVYKNLTGKEKVAKYESLKKEKFGPYYDAMAKREDPYQNYQTELAFMEEDFRKLSADETTRTIRSILEKHFGTEEAERMVNEAKKEEALRLEREKKIKEYETVEKKFKSDNPNISSEDLEKKLSELRGEMLGE